MSHSRQAWAFEDSHREEFESGPGPPSPVHEFLRFGCPVSAAGSRDRICLSFPYQRDPIIGSAQFLTHGRQFGEKNEESGDDGTIPRSTFCIPAWPRDAPSPG